MKIAMYDLEGHFLELFEVDTVIKLENQLGVSKGGINACLSGKALSTKNYQFRLVINTNKVLTRVGDVSNIIEGQSYKPVHKLYNGKFICSYDNMTRAAEINRTDVTGISKCCNGKQKKSGGFEWCFANTV
jgi:hypothetical protein